MVSPTGQWAGARRRRLAARIWTKIRKYSRWSTNNQSVLRCRFHEDCRSRTIFCDHRQNGTGKIGLSWFMSRIHITSRWRLIQSKRMDPWKHEDRSSVAGNSQWPPRPLRNRDKNQLLVGRRISISGYDLHRIQQIRDGNVRRKTRKPRWHKWRTRGETCC